ncbi:hypothetical protein [Bordetella bronchiseptica]|uniref:hypothetical protein n=1 Tax=Bordetella bronchiseptica TaxID=518 RepID=UPI0002FDBD01|nr:hypothetical protein [Bordetella bronchiseptica]KAK65383.1 hypothetical protein L530_0511 [Bordetella bronchiseptica MO211]
MNSLPIVIGEVGVNHTDHATRRFQLDSQRQGAQTGRNAFTNIVNAGIQPSTAVGAMIDFRNRIAHRPSPRHQVVIPTDRMKPRALQPFQHIGRFRASAYKILYGKQSFLFWRKLYGSQRDFKPSKPRTIPSVRLCRSSFLIIFFAQRKTSGLGARLAGGIAFDAVTFRNRAQGIGNVVNPKTTRRDMQSGMMVTAGRTNHMIAGNTMWNPAYRQHILQNMGKNWGPATDGSVNGK